MPISTPENLLPKYSNDENHFEHVLEHLLIPSLEKVDLEAIPPITKGSELIHGEIIKNIEITDLILCDMSILNPNVFFELGIRTALNKPVCLIKDDATLKIPFDTSIINYHTYKNALNPWTLDKEIEALSNHIEESLKRSNDTNSLWKYFSLNSTAHSVEPEKGMEGRMDFLAMQFEALRKQLQKDRMGEYNIPLKDEEYRQTMKEIMNIAIKNDEKINYIETDKSGNIKVNLMKSPSSPFVESIYSLSRNFSKGILLVDNKGETVTIRVGEFNKTADKHR